MEFKEIEALAREQSPLNEQYPSLYVISAHYALSELYRRFHSQQISQDEAVKEKQKIRAAFTQLRSEHEKYLAVYQTFTERIKISEDFRVRIHKAINSGEDLTETLLLTCTCIASLTGDDTLCESVVAKQLSLLDETV